MKKLPVLTALALISWILSACQQRVNPLPTETSSPPLPSATTTPLASATVAATPTLAFAILDDFEADATKWIAGKAPAYRDSSALEVTLTNEGAAQGKQALALRFEKTDQPKAIFALEGQFDLSQGRYLSFELNDPDGAAEAVAIAICTGSDWYWHESAPMAVQPGTNTLTFDLQAKSYKTAASSWELNSGIANLADVKRLAILVFPKTSGMVYVDDMRLLQTDESLTLSMPATLTASTPQPTQPPPDCPGVVASPPSDAPLVLYAPQGSLTQFERVEFDLSTTLHVENPYDPAQIDLGVTYTAPDGSQFSVPAFWYQGFDPAVGGLCGQPGWKARLTPTQAGRWSAQAFIAGQETRSQPLTFDVQASDRKGFVRLHPTDQRYFAFDDGSFFFPVGLNIGWWRDDPLEDYARWMDALQANGGNLIRVWMASWSFGIEWKDTGLGDYTKRQYQAWLLDRLFEMARERDIYIELVLLNHGAFSATVNPEWSDNPYNAALGGPLQSPADFATDETARRFFERRVRYIASRWGYSTQLFAWEWWNEVNWTPITNADLAVWTAEMSHYLKQFDPYDHLISLSYATTGDPAVLNLPEVDFIQQHTYSKLDPLDDFPTTYRWLNQVAPGKPVLFAEFGYSADGEDARSFDRQGIHLHNGLWAATFSGFASPAMYWWWDSYIEPLDLWGQFAGLTNFLQQEDLTQLRTLGEGKISLSDHTAKVLALYNDQLLLAWIRNEQFETYVAETQHDGDIRYKKTPDAEWKFHLDPLSGLTLTITALPEGSYLVRWYDPASGQWFSESEAAVQDGKLTLPVPTFNFDLALKISRR